MITFLCILYLAFTICLSLRVVITAIRYLDEEDHWIVLTVQFISCILWSIWYFYFLH